MLNGRKCCFLIDSFLVCKESVSHHFFHDIYVHHGPAHAPSPGKPISSALRLPGVSPSPRQYPHSRAAAQRTHRAAHHRHVLYSPRVPLYALTSSPAAAPRLIYALSRLGHATPAEGALPGVRNAQVRRPNSASVRDEYNRQSSYSSWHLQLANGMPGTASGGNLNREGSLRALMPIEALVRTRSPW